MLREPLRRTHLRCSGTNFFVDEPRASELVRCGPAGNRFRLRHVGQRCTFIGFTSRNPGASRSFKDHITCLRSVGTSITVAFQLLGFVDVD